MFCCCSGKKNSGIATFLSAGLALATAGIVVFDKDSADAETTPMITLSELVAGAWEGVATGEGLPPEGVPFTMDLFSKDDGGVGGTLTSGMGVFDILEGAYSEQEQVFTCVLSNPQDPTMNADMIAVVDGDAMAGAVTAGAEFEAEFSAERNRN